MKAISICEVGPRDGLQSLGVKLSIDERCNFISGLYSAGLRKIEVGSIVNPKAVPEMADSDRVFTQILKQWPENNDSFSLLVPNMKGLEIALELGCKYIAFFTATSESFNRKNINRSVTESISDIERMLKKIESQNIRKRLYISTVFDCPFDGVQNVSGALTPFHNLFEQVDEVSLGDTTGRGNSSQVNILGTELLGSTISDKIWWHFHDTYQNAADNTKAALKLGFYKYDSSAGGIGGCPFSPGAKGNISTEKLIEVSEKSGFTANIDIEKVRKLALPIAALKG